MLAAASLLVCRLTYLIVTEECEIDTSDCSNGNVELGAAKAVELLHGGYLGQDCSGQVVISDEPS